MVRLMPRKETLSLLKDKLDGKNSFSYQNISDMTGYSKRQLLRLSIELEEKDIEEALIHGNSGRHTQNAAKDTEIDISITTIELSLNRLLKEDKIKKIGTYKNARYISNKK